MRDEHPFLFAALWEHWRSPDGVTLETCSLITTTPNDVVRPLHDRMPVMLPDDVWERWLDPAAADPGELRAMLEPSDAIALRIHPVERLVNDVRRDGPDLIEPLAPVMAVEGESEGTLGI